MFVKQVNNELSNNIKYKKNIPKGKNMPDTMKAIIWISQNHNTVCLKLYLIKKKTKLLFLI